jgi:RHS repeat-associated protein
MRPIVPPDVGSYSYAGMSYANPHAVTSIGNGLSTSTFSYDNDGNLIQKTVDGTTTTYVWDYANRLTALGVGGATTTYGYDAFGQRVLQTGTSTTTIYPFKWYSVASSTGTGAKYSTTTVYVWNGEGLVATVDQQLASGVATGSPATRYIHPDHLGSTNVVTDASGTLVQTLDFYPYGATRVSFSTSTNEKRQFIGQFSDSSGLDYLNARYYDPARGQFLSDDPSFLAVGDPNAVKQVTGQDQRTFLSDPQQMNSTSYGRDNPITNKDPNGREAYTWNLLNMSAEEGFGAYGYASFNVALSFGRNTQTGEKWIAPSVSFATGMGSVNGQVSGFPAAKAKSDAPPFVVGVFGGITPLVGGAYSPDANTPDDLSGRSKQSSLNGPLLSVSTQQDQNGSLSDSVNPGARGLASVSNYPVQTWVPGSYSMSRGTFSLNPTIGAAINRIQAQINTIRGTIAKLLAGSNTAPAPSR